MQVGAPCGTTHVHLMPCACQQQAYPAVVGKTWKSQQTNQRPPLHQNRQWLSHPSVPPLGLYFVMVIYCCWYLLCKCVLLFFFLFGLQLFTSSAGVIWRQCGQVAPPSLTPPLTTYQWGQADMQMAQQDIQETNPGLIAGSPLLCQEVIFLPPLMAFMHLPKQHLSSCSVKKQFFVTRVHRNGVYTYCGWSQNELLIMPEILSVGCQHINYSHAVVENPKH